MDSARNVAFRMLQSGFFGQLRNVLPGAGLSEEEKIGVGVFFVMISRFRPHPLRLALQEKAEGGVKYVVRKVSQLFEVGTTCNVFSQGGWSRFAADPTHKIAYVPDWSDSHDRGMRVRIDGNRLVRLLRFERDGRVVEEPQQVEGPFVCISSERLREMSSPGRWLTINMPAPPWKAPIGVSPLDDKTFATWVEVQRLLEKRAKLQIVLPDWADVFIHHANQNEYARWCLPAFIEAWKTMSLLRSFQEPDRREKAVRRTCYIANFEDLAETGALLRGVFREGRYFPSVKKIFAEVFPNGREFSVVDPLTGKGRKYSPLRQAPVKYKSLLEEAEWWHEKQPK
jgi:hypothetical protein